MPRSGESSYKYKDEWITVRFVGAVLTDTRFAVELPDPRYGGVIKLCINLQGRSYRGVYEYISGPYKGCNGTLQLGRENHDDGSVTFLGQYLEKAYQGYAGYEDHWKFEVFPPA